MIERVKIKSTEIIDLGYAKIYVDSKPLEEFTEDYLEESISADYYNSSENCLQWNFYWIILSEDKSKGKLIKDIEDAEHYARRYVLTPTEYQKFLKRFPIYNSSIAGKVTLFNANRLGEKTEEALNFYKNDWENTIFLSSSLMNMYELLEALEILDHFRAQVLYGKNLVAVLNIDEEKSLFRKKFKFLGTNYIQR